MNSRIACFSAIAFALALAACGTDDPGNTPDGGVADADPTQWVTLIEGDWTLPGAADPDSEGYRCVYKTVTEDLYVKAFQAIIPLGTHHTVVTVGNPGPADGIYTCDAGTNASAQIYGSGVGTNSIVFPPGVAVKIPAGQQVLLNLHLFNTADSELSGTSGTRIQTMPLAEVVHEAESILMGKVLLSVPENESTQIGTCVMNGDVTIFAMQPHMHQLGTHMMVVAERALGGNVTIWDAPYSFDEQIASLVGPVQMAKDDTVKVHCTYNNTTGAPVGFGDSSNDEMCFAGVYRYPKFGGTFGIICAN